MFTSVKTAEKKTIALFALVAVVVLTGIGFGVSYAWRESRGPTAATAEDCVLAQELFDKAGTVPSGKEEAKAFEKEIRAMDYPQFVDQGIRTEVGKYVTWKVSKVTGEGTPPSREKFDEMVENAQGHCSDQQPLNIPAYDF
ncbi:hypothetical protein [Saccharopolyspora hattusasensis]|uniref:hypothetical protein n=1 Tax=Saccharopolyspora hattusasensis TaxID=1128679 RepID=UPI003D9684C0